jgi:L-amino acid N-acyltransferase YncA
MTRARRPHSTAIQTNRALIRLAIPMHRREPAGMTLLIRDSLPGDIPAITAIYAHAVLHGNASFELDPPDTKEVARRRDTLLAAGYPYLTAERDGEVVGYTCAGPYRPRPGYRFTVENSVYVSPDHQGQGIGGALLPRLIDRCDQAGYRLMIAVIGDSANHASIRLHAGCGFTHAGLLPAIGWKHGRWLDSVLMTRALGPGATEPPER